LNFYKRKEFDEAMESQNSFIAQEIKEKELEKIRDKLKLMPDEYVLEMAKNFIGIGYTKKRTTEQLIRAILQKEEPDVLNKYITDNSANATGTTETTEEDILKLFNKPELLEMAKSFGLPPISERKPSKKIIEFIMKNVKQGQINEYVGSMPLDITPNKPDTSNEPDNLDKTLDEMKKKELLLLAEQYGLTKFSKQNKEVLRKRIREKINETKDDPEKTGLGLKKQKRRKIVGRGSSDESETRKEFNGKYIDLKKLRENILSIKYVKTNTYIPTVKSQHINDDLKEVITDLVSDKFDKRLFEKLLDNDKRLLKRIIKAFSLNIDLKDMKEEEYRKQYDILLGQLRAGNNSPLIKNKLKEYILDSNESGLLTRREMWNLLHELTNA
jgi:hypothetical protein